MIKAVRTSIRRWREHRDGFLGGAYAALERAVGGRKVTDMRGFAGKEQSIVERTCQLEASGRLARQRMAIGAAYCRGTGPVRGEEGTETFAHIGTKQPGELFDRVSEGRIGAFRLDCPGAGTPVETLDDRPAIGSDVVAARRRVMRVADDMRLRLEGTVAEKFRERASHCTRAADGRRHHARDRAPRAR